MEQVKTIGKDFSLKELIRFVSTPIATQILFSLLMSLDDSLFISRFIGTDGLAAFSIIWPMFSFFDSIVSIFTSSATYCSTLMGERKYEDSNRAFSTTVLIAAIFGLICSIVIKTFINPIFVLLGCTKKLWPLCLAQFNVQCWLIATSFVSRTFTTFYVVAGKPKVATFTTLTSTVINVLFDYIFVGVLNMGMAGTAYANGLGHVFNIVFGIFFFTRQESEIKFGTPNYPLNRLLPAIIKIGIPRTATSLALSVNGIISHRILLQYSNENALSANSIVNSLQFMFMSGFFGLADTISPLLGYAYGEKNKTKLERIVKQFLQITLGLSVLIVILYLLANRPLLSLYIKPGSPQELIDMTTYGLKIAPFVFLFLGLSVYSQSVFNDTQNSKYSMILTILENVIFSNINVILLPNLFGLNGYWYSFLISEIETVIVSIILLIKENDKLTDFKEN